MNMASVDLRLLRYFLAVAEEAHLTKAPNAWASVSRRSASRSARWSRNWA